MTVNSAFSGRRPNFKLESRNLECECLYDGLHTSAFNPQLNTVCTEALIDRQWASESVASNRDSHLTAGGS